MKYLSICCALLSFSLLSAQNLQTPTLSPFTEITQEVGLTDISLSYARPSAKGRTVFGELVPYDQIWRTGANASTKLTVTEDVQIAGNALPAGTYSLYTIPGRQEWTIIIHKNTSLRSIAGGRVKPENDAFRFQVRPVYNPLHVETFTIQFADIRSDQCQLRLSWANTIVQFAIQVEVDAKIEAQMAELMQQPDEVSDRVLFRAAEYYLHNQKDLDQAMSWIDLALEKNSENFRYGLLKAKIYKAQGQIDQAISTVKTANEWATAAENQNYMEQTRVYLASLTSPGDETPDLAASPYADDVSSLDNIMKALYASISGEKGEKRDWARFQYLFVPEARLMPSRKKSDGSMSYSIMSPADYVQNAGSWLEENGFYEVEIKREVEEYASLVHVFSTYESYRSKEDTEPFARGINSIQLQNDGKRWWIIHIYWLGESEEWPLPAGYLPNE